MIGSGGRYFKASMDATAKVTTVLITVLFVWVATIPYTVAREAVTGQLAANLMLLMILLIYAISYLLRIKGYLVSNEQLLILRPLGKKQISLASIRSSVVLSRRDLFWSLRTFGVGGLFGYYGKFFNRKFGAMTWYITRRDTTVLLYLDDGRKILVSPDDWAEFQSLIGAKEATAPY
jgi:hypothetical protein